jgi:hypothetical protein
MLSISTISRRSYGDFADGRRRRRPSTSPRASSWCCSAPRAAARPRRCAWSPASCAPSAGRDHHRRARRHQPAALEAQLRAGLPELCALPAYDRRARTSPSAWRCARCAPAEIAVPRVAEALRLVQLTGFDERYPRQLSGGQQQRVALARALAIRARRAAARRAALQSRRQAARRRSASRSATCSSKLGLTTIMVTHDQEEALTMADRLVVMEKGKVRQIGTQRELYEKPADRFVAGFIGRSAFLEGADDGAGALPQRAAGSISPAPPPPRLDRQRWRSGPSASPSGLRRMACANRFPARSSTSPISARCSTSRSRLNEQDRMMLQIPNRVGRPSRSRATPSR